MKYLLSLLAACFVAAAVADIVIFTDGGVTSFTPTGGSSGSTAALEAAVVDTSNRLTTVESQTNNWNSAVGSVPYAGATNAVNLSGQAITNASTVAVVNAVTNNLALEWWAASNRWADVERYGSVTNVIFKTPAR